MGSSKGYTHTHRNEKLQGEISQRNDRRGFKNRQGAKTFIQSHDAMDENVQTDKVLIHNLHLYQFKYLTCTEQIG